MHVQAKELQGNLIGSTSNDQEHRVSQEAKGLPPYVGTVFSRMFVEKHSSSFQAHLERISTFWAAGRRPYIVFTFTGSVRNVRIDVNIYIYIYMSTTWRTRSRYVIFWLYFGEIHLSAPAFISEESFQPEEFFVVLF